MSPWRLAIGAAAMLLLSAPTHSLSAEMLPGTSSGLTDGRAAVVAAAESNGSPADLSETIRTRYRSIRAVVALRGHRTVVEYYRDGTGPVDLLPAASVTKSVMSTLIGVALGQGAFSSLDQQLGDFLPEALEPGIDGRVREITVRHILTMMSGFDPDKDPTSTPASSMLWRWSLHRPMLDEPGRQFRYDNQASHLLSVLLSRATKQDASRFAQEHLFGPLGITKYVWPVDAEGHLLGAFGLLLTARDMAKIGSLYLRGGQWNGKQLVPRSYVGEATQAHNRAGPPVSAADYGYLWWITRPSGEPAAYFAAGSGGQLIYVVPTLDLVVAVAGSASGAGGRQLINQAIIPFVQTRPVVR
jgi:CubicO group peptidase (beta-lactamase class C family)